MFDDPVNQTLSVFATGVGAVAGRGELAHAMTTTAPLKQKPRVRFVMEQKLAPHFLERCQLNRST
jgi:hypothetical protein